MAAGSEDLQQVAERVWGALDRMAAEDPEGYQKFIGEQLREGKEVMATPDPVLCVRCPLEGGKARYLYLNVCKWSRVPRPKTDNDPIPVKGGVVRHLLHERSKRKTPDLLYDVAFHPQVLEECMREAELEQMLLALCWDYLENETKLRIKNRKDCKKLKACHKGPLSDVHSSINEEWRDSLNPDSKLDIGDSILTQLREMKMGKDSNEDALPKLKLFPDKPAKVEGDSIQTQERNTSGQSLQDRESTSSNAAFNGTHPPDSKVLIQELRSDVQASYDHTEGGSHVCIPAHSVAVNEGAGNMREVCVTVKLPGVKAATEVELEVSQSDLMLDVSGQYHLDLQFPETVQDEMVRATFNTRLATMTVTLLCTLQTT